MYHSKDKELLNNVRQAYSKIPRQWDRLRRHPSPQWKYLESFIHDGDRVLDAGCGNGRFADFLKTKRVEYTGIDSNKELIQIARHRYAKASDVRYSFVVADMLALPFPDHSFDVAVSLAAFHHLPSRDLRITALNEMRRVLAPTGKLIMFNWNLRCLRWFIRYRPWKLLLGGSDCTIDWKDDHGATVRRYYHSFTLNELRQLLRKAHFSIDECFYVTDGRRACWWNGLNSFVRGHRTL